jgi:type I restriction enzyme S subunit
MDKNTENKKPEVRFKDFTDDWNIEKLEKLANFSKGRGYSKSDLLESGTPIILYGRLYTNYQTIINEVDTFAIPREDSIYSSGNEVIVPASGETPEDIIIASAVIKKDVLLGGDLNIIIPHDSLNSVFLALSVSNGKVKKDLVKRAQGKSVVHIRNNDLKEAFLNFPHITEQNTITRFFQNLDNLITNHQKRYDKLIVLKKAMLVKMFPKDGTFVPEIRFKGFTDNWEKKKVGELLVERNIQSPKSEKYPLMSFIAYKGVVPKGDRYNRESLVNDELNKKYKQTEYGDFIYSSNNLETGSIGLNNHGQASISPVYSIFKQTELADPDFIGRLLVRKNFINQMVRWRQGVVYGQWRIHESDFVKIEVDYTSFEEQQKIGQYFKNLDNLISLQKTQLNKLKNIKKACFTKMFVSQD